MTINKAIEKILLEQLKKFQTDNNRMTIVGRVKKLKMTTNDQYC